MVDDSINKPPDLTDPKVLAQYLDMVVQSLRQQAEASRMGTAMGGHPFPNQLYNMCANVCEAAKAFVVKNTPPDPPPAPEPAPAPEPKPGKNK